MPGASAKLSGRSHAIRQRAQAAELRALRYEINPHLPFCTTRRPEALRYLALAQGYAEKINAGYDWLETEIGKDAPLHVGHVMVATVFS